MQTQNGVPNQHPHQLRQFNKHKLREMELFIAFARDEFLIIPPAQQSEYITQKLFYLDSEINIEESVSMLRDMSVHFLALSKDKRDPAWAVNHYYSQILRQLAGFFSDLEWMQCCLYV